MGYSAATMRLLILFAFLTLSTITIQVQIRASATAQVAAQQLEQGKPIERELKAKEMTPTNSR